MLGNFSQTVDDENIEAFLPSLIEFLSLQVVSRQKCLAQSALYPFKVLGVEMHGTHA